MSNKWEPSLQLEQHGIKWYSESILPWGPGSYLKQANHLTEEINPDWIIGFSDTYYGIIAEYLARNHGTRSLIDAYDNYESYIPWMKPLHVLWRRSLSNAHAVTAAGPNLAQLMNTHRTPEHAARVIPMSADPVGFEPLPMSECRQHLGLPADTRLLGYCGAIYPNRTISVLFDAYRKLLKDMPDLKLVLSGRVHKDITIPDDAIWLGYLADKNMPLLINSLDVLAVINDTSAFGNYSFPVKLYEAMACQTPVAVSSTPASQWILERHSQFLAKPGNPHELAKTIMASLQHAGQFDYGYQPTWEDHSNLFEEILLSNAQ